MHNIEDVETIPKSTVSYVRKKGLTFRNSRNANKGPAKSKLPSIDLNVLVKNVRCVKNSGTEISIFKSNKVPEKYGPGEKIDLIPAIGNVERADSQYRSRCGTKYNHVQPKMFFEPLYNGRRSTCIDLFRVDNTFSM